MGKSKKQSKVVQKPQSDNVEARMMIASSFSGPLPPPNVLRGYEGVLPGSADRIISMAEKQLSHRHDVEARIVKSNLRNESVGMWLSFILTMALMGFGFYLIINDKETAGYFLVFGPVVFHGINYIYNKKREVDLADSEK